MDGTIVTFYSYKGGTGRSMALANTAWILASNGLRVLAVDWDLEAPGLHRYFHPFLRDRDLQLSSGIINLIWDFAAAAIDTDAPDEPRWHEKFARISPHATSIDFDFPDGGTIDLVPAGRQDSAYSSLVSTFDWSNFYEQLGGGGFLEALKRSMRERYDYVLVDSRTGLSDTAGICTVQLPDILVNCFSLSTQAVEGAAAVAASVLRLRGDRQIRIFPVPMRVEDGEQDKLDASRDFARDRFGRHLFHVADPERYWGEVEIPYKSFYAYEEILATIGDRPQQENTVLAATERVVAYLTDRRVTKLNAPSSEFERRALLARFQRGGSVDPAIHAMASLGESSSRVFVSYVYESAEQFEAVRELWFLLRSHGIDARLDLLPGQRPPNWPTWLAEELGAADFLVVILTPTYKQAADGSMTDRDNSERGLGARLVRDATLAGLSLRRVAPVFLPGTSAAQVPEFLRESPVEPISVSEMSTAGVAPLIRRVTRISRTGEQYAQTRVSWLEPLSRKLEPPVEATVEYLRQAVSAQWRAEATARQIAGPRLGTLRWTVTERPVTPRLTDGRAEQLASELRGRTQELAETLRSLPYGQLVVLGSPGSGKTTTMIRLALDLLSDRWNASPVPVFLPAVSWDPLYEPLRSWIAQWLREDYALRGPSRARVAPEHLIDRGLIIPILDGLDEMSPLLRGVALRELAAAGDKLPFVLSCRTLEYQEAVRVSGRTLPTAVVVELQPVEIAEATKYLVGDAPVGDDRWQPVFDHVGLHPDTPLSGLVASPLLLTLLRDTYRSPETSPDELIDEARFPASRDIELYLGEKFVDDAYVVYPFDAKRSTHTQGSARRWLSTIAQSMQREGRRQFSWWNIRNFGSEVKKEFQFGLIGGLFGALVCGLLSTRLAVLPHTTQAPSWVIGVGEGYIFGSIAAFCSQLSAWPIMPYGLLGDVLVAMILRFTSAAPGSSTNPLAVLRRYRSVALASVILWPILISSVYVLIAIAAGARLASIIGTVPVVVVGVILIAFGRSKWGSYKVALFSLALSGSLPWNLMRFLDEAYRRGIMRRVGDAYQFRHQLLLDSLAASREDSVN